MVHKCEGLPPWMRPRRPPRALAPVLDPEAEEEDPSDPAGPVGSGPEAEAVLAAACGVLALRHPHRPEGYWRDLLLAHALAPPAQHAAAMERLGDAADGAVDAHATLAALRLLDVRARVLGAAPNAVRAEADAAAAEALRRLGPAMDTPDPRRAPAVLLEGAGAELDAMRRELPDPSDPRHCPALEAAGDCTRGLLAAAPSHAAAEAEAGGRVDGALRALGDYATVLAALQSQAAAAVRCLDRCEELTAVPEALERMGGTAAGTAEAARQWCAAAEAAVAGARMQHAEAVGRGAEQTARRMDELTEGYARIRALEEALAAERSAAEEREAALLEHVARCAALPAVADAVPSQLAAALAAAHRTGAEWGAVADAARSGAVAVAGRLADWRAHLEGYRHEVGSRLASAHAAHWEASAALLRAIDHSAGAAGRRLRAVRQHLRAREAAHAQWERVARALGDGPPTDAEAALLQSTERWQQELSDVRTLVALRERDVARWADARAAVCTQLEASGTRAAVAPHTPAAAAAALFLHPSGDSTDGDPATPAAVARSMESVRTVLGHMRDLHHRFADFYEEVHIQQVPLAEAADSWRLMAEACATLQRLLAEVMGVADPPAAGDPSNLQPRAAPPFGSAWGMGSIDFSGPLAGHPFLRAEVGTALRQLQDDLLVYGCDVSAALRQPLHGVPLEARWRGLLQLLGALVAPPPPPTAPSVPLEGSTADVRSVCTADLDDDLVSLSEDDSFFAAPLTSDRSSPESD